MPKRECVVRSLSRSPDDIVPIGTQRPSSMGASAHGRIWNRIHPPPYSRWIRTGDEVLFRENGDMFIVDRLKVRRHPRARSPPSTGQFIGRRLFGFVRNSSSAEGTKWPRRNSRDIFWTIPMSRMSVSSESQTNIVGRFRWHSSC